METVLAVIGVWFLISIPVSLVVGRILSTNTLCENQETRAASPTQDS